MKSCERRLTKYQNYRRTDTHAPVKILDIGCRGCIHHTVVFSSRVWRTIDGVILSYRVTGSVQVVPWEKHVTVNRKRHAGMHRYVGGCYLTGVIFSWQMIYFMLLLIFVFFTLVPVALFLWKHQLFLFYFCDVYSFLL